MSKGLVTMSWILLLAAVVIAAPQDEQMRLAGQYQKAGRFEEALEIYQGLLAKSPGDDQILSKIQGVYKELKRYPQLIELINGRLAREQGNFDLHVALGEAHFLSGQLTRAKETWLRAVQLAPKEESSYLLVSNAFMERGMLTEAEQVLEQGRESLGDESAFADVLARLYELRADYRAATGEYLSWVVQDIRRLNYVDSRLAQYPQDDGVMEMVAETLQLAAVAEPEQVAFRHLYGHHLLRLGEPELAYEEFLVLNEKEKSSSGKVLLQFARRCSEQGYYAAAIRACREVSTRYPESPTARQAQLAVGDNLAIMERYQEALTAYGKLVQEHQESMEAREALFARGEIYFLHLGDLDSALDTFRILGSGAGDGVRTEDAAFRIGDCLVVRGDLEGARSEYDRLAQASRHQDVRERAAYKLAELTMLEGEFGEARRQFDDLVKTFPQGFYVNDALVRSMFLDEALSGGQQEVLGAFMTALGLDRRRDYQGALEAYQRALEEFPESSLGADILFEMARAQEKIGQYREALADLEKLIADYPQSRLCPESQRRIGAIYELRLGDLPMAVKAYERVLSNYPRYLFLDEVRKNIRRLKDEGAG